MLGHEGFAWHLIHGGEHEQIPRCEMPGDHKSTIAGVADFSPLAFGAEPTHAQ
jgi:hypothetical protein